MTPSSTVPTVPSEMELLGFVLFFTLSLSIAQSYLGGNVFHLWIIFFLLFLTVPAIAEVFPTLNRVNTQLNFFFRGAHSR